jgi:hypothetical protein
MFDENDTLFKHPFCMTVAGPSQCGKTRFIMDVLQKKNTTIQPFPTKILYCYSDWQDNFNELIETIPFIEFQEGLPKIESIDINEVNLVILDDLMSKCVKDEKILHLFTVGSHHKNTSVIFLSQNIFCQGKHARTISLNCHYLVLFKNPRDPSQISTLGRQIFPKNTNFFDEAFKDAITQPYGYLIVDLKQNSPESLRLRTIDRNSGKIFVYTKK